MNTVFVNRSAPVANPVARPASVATATSFEAQCIAADLHHNQLKISGALRRYEDQRAIALEFGVPFNWGRFHE